MHVDFMRVEANKALKVNVPLHFTNEDKCTGVKLGGGMIQHQATDIEIQCLPKDIPEYIEVDMPRSKWDKSSTCRTHPSRGSDLNGTCPGRGS